MKNTLDFSYDLPSQFVETMVIETLSPSFSSLYIYKKRHFPLCAAVFSSLLITISSSSAACRLRRPFNENHWEWFVQLIGDIKHRIDASLCGKPFPRGDRIVKQKAESVLRSETQYPYGWASFSESQSYPSCFWTLHITYFPRIP